MHSKLQLMLKNLEALKHFAKLYEEYKILNFEKNNFSKEDFKKNHALLLTSVKHLGELTEEVEESTPSTLITFQVIAEGFVTKERYVDVQLNLKQWQVFAKMSDASQQLRGILRVLTGFNESDL
tara:strand:+ start:416 stop:787 length:372 start_codon:yes stop_codon:yes gene_type:complete